MISTDERTPPAGAIAAKKGNEVVRKPYRIGEGHKSLHIDPMAKVATLTGGWKVGYQCLDSETTICNRGWQLSPFMSIASMSSGSLEGLSLNSTPRTSPISCDTNKTPANSVVPSFRHDPGLGPTT